MNIYVQLIGSMSFLLDILYKLPFVEHLLPLTKKKKTKQNKKKKERANILSQKRKKTQIYSPKKETQHPTFFSKYEFSQKFA